MPTLSHSEHGGRRPKRALAWSLGSVGALVLAVAGYLIVGAATGLPTSVPSCSWSLRIDGRATSEQAGLIRCYLRALARHDPGGLLAVADTTSAAVRITSTDSQHSADARAGTARASFTPAQNDDSYLVRIVFADRAHETIAMVLANPGSIHSWRLGLGRPTHSGGGPAPLKP